MVDTIKFLPSLRVASPSNTHRIKYTITSENITLPILISAVTSRSPSDRKTTLENAKRWIGRCPLDPPRQTGTNETSSILYRKFIDQEMARYYPGATIDMSASIKLRRKQQPEHQLKYKDILGETQRVLVNTGTTVRSNPLKTRGSDHSSRLFNTLSKPVTIKPEPIRALNYTPSGKSAVSSSWRKYWTSVKAQRLGDIGDSKSGLYCSKCSRIFSSTKEDCIAVQGSFSSSSIENQTISRTPTNPSFISTSTDDLLPIVSDQQISIRKGSRVSSPKIIPSDSDSLAINRLQTMKDIDFPSTETINKMSRNENKTGHTAHAITTKVYQLPLPSNKPKLMKSMQKTTQHTKSPESMSPIRKLSPQKKETISVQDTSTHKPQSRKTTRQQNSSSQRNRTPSRNEKHSSAVRRQKRQSSYESSKFCASNINDRYIEPAAPPSSPALYTFGNENNQYEDESCFQQNASYEFYS